MDHPSADSAATHDLLRQAQAGDRAAREQLLNRHRHYLHRAVELRLDRQLRARVDPSDVVQEAQIEALRRLDTYLLDPPMPFHLWLRRIAYDRLLMLHRYHVGAARRTAARDIALPDGSALQAAAQLLAAGTTPSQCVVRHELVRRVHRVLLQLPPDEREVLLLRTYEGLYKSGTLMLGRGQPTPALA
jgi:RNA polymerase sigma-70 factor (ECF subfamily)